MLTDSTKALLSLSSVTGRNFGYKIYVHIQHIAFITLVWSLMMIL